MCPMARPTPYCYTHTMRFNLDASEERQALVAEAVAGLCRELDIPATLREVGVPESGLELIASATLHDRQLATNPKPISDAGPIMTVLREAW